MRPRLPRGLSRDSGWKGRDIADFDLVEDDHHGDGDEDDDDVNDLGDDGDYENVDDGTGKPGEKVVT